MAHAPVSQTQLEDEVYEAAAEALEMGALVLEAEREAQMIEMMLELPEQPFVDTLAEMEAETPWRWRENILDEFTVVGEDDLPY